MEKICSTYTGISLFLYTVRSSQYQDSTKQSSNPEGRLYGNNVNDIEGMFPHKYLCCIQNYLYIYLLLHL
jgi:hypothetical protein